MAAVFVTLAQAKGHLRITDTDHDSDIQLKLNQAESTINDYLKSRVDIAWTDETTVAPPVQAAILLLCAHFYEHRGDDMKPDAALWQAIERLLMRYRDPALA